MLINILGALVKKNKRINFYNEINNIYILKKENIQVTKLVYHINER
jgi:hypothetical protein